MTTLSIKDLAADKEMDRDAMADVSGGMAEIFGGFPGSFNFQSPVLVSKVTPITGVAEIPTVQGNYLNQLDNTNATNGDGTQFISNNKSAHQSNSNRVGGVLSPFVG